MRGHPSPERGADSDRAASEHQRYKLLFNNDLLLGRDTPSCPECRAPLVASSGCRFCPHCGWDLVRLTLVPLDVRRRGTEFVEVPVRSVLNPPESTGMPFWSLNPYVGCEFGCAYCYARFAHDYRIQRSVSAGQLPAGTEARLSALERPWLAFERAILVKRRREFVAAFARDLERLRRRAMHAPQSIAIGTATDPYQPADRRFGLTRVALEHLVQWSDPRGGSAPPRLQLSVVTKSGLVTRDAELLRALNRRHHVAVYLSIVTLDARLIRLVEPRSPLPRVRIRAIRRLAAAGVPVGVFCAPGPARQCRG